MTESHKTQKSTIDRRKFIQGATVLAASSVCFNPEKVSAENTIPKTHYDQASSRIDKNVKVVHSVCLGCNARCGNRQVVKDGRLEEITGNPFHPYNSMGKPIEYTTPVADSLSLSSPVCGKAHDAVGYVYNQRRILKPLKRAGSRGEGKFEEISWEQLIQDVSQGGKLFSNIGENRIVPGLNDCLSDELIAPEDPSLGSKRNGFSLMTGRLQSGRKEFIDRFVKNSVGSINRIGHTDICGLGFRMGNYVMTEGKQVELKADPWNAEYVLVFGANIYEALQPGLNTYGAAIANRYSKNEVKFAIVDPRAQNASVHAHDWIPVIPGQDGAFAMAMIRLIIENKRYNSDYLTIPNLAMPKRSDFSCYSNATHLIIDEPSHPHYGKFLRQSDLEETEKEGEDRYMVIDLNGNITTFNSVEKAELEYDMDVSHKTGKIRVVTAFSMMKREAMLHTLKEYSERCGISVEQIKKTAKDFTSYGTKAAVCQYHGAGNYTNGTYAAFSIALLNVLIGSIGVKGGYLTGGGAAGSWKKGPYDLVNFPGKKKASGVKISREKGSYEKSTEYQKKKDETGSGYPAKRPWPTFTKGGLSVEALSGIDEGYPYECEVLFTYFYNPVYSTPGGYRYVETLKDADKVPLHVSIDIGINESNLFADYIVPDVTYLEGQYGWLNPHAPALKFTGVRVPCLEPLTGKTKDNKPFCLETFLIDIAINLNLDGFGKNAFSKKNGSSSSLLCAEDFYLRAYANIAADAKLPQASDTEVAFVESNCPISKYKGIVTKFEWQQICYMLARGGIFKRYEDVFDNNKFLHGIERVVLYNEKLAATRNSLTGKLFSGTIQCMSPEDSTGKNIAKKDHDYPYSIVTFKMHVHTQSRTVWHGYAMELFPENLIQINSTDAKTIGVKSNDIVLLRSASNVDGVKGKIEVTECIRPGCVGISFHYGHTQLGANAINVRGAKNVFLGGKDICEGDTLKPAPALGKGTNPNMVGRLDENQANTPLVDVLAGIPDFSSTQVKIEKIV
ncbi:MAG: molybdopterin-dependent oxidoreductase [Desulfotalea sp.]